MKEKMLLPEESISPELKEEQVDQTPPEDSVEKGKENEFVSPELIVGQFDQAPLIQQEAGPVNLLPSEEAPTKREADISNEVDVTTFDQTPPKVEEPPYEEQPLPPLESLPSEGLVASNQSRGETGTQQEASGISRSYSAPPSPVRSIHKKVLNILGRGKVLPSEARRMEQSDSWSQAEPEVTFIIAMEPIRTTETRENEAPAIRPKHQMRRASHPSVRSFIIHYSLSDSSMTEFFEPQQVHPIRKKFIEPMLLAEREEEKRVAKLQEERNFYLQKEQTSSRSQQSNIPMDVMQPASEPSQSPADLPDCSLETTPTALSEDKSLPLLPEVPETIPSVSDTITQPNEMPSFSASQKDLRSMYSLPAQVRYQQYDLVCC